jgi:hypothetical protein
MDWPIDCHKRLWRSLILIRVPALCRFYLADDLSAHWECAATFRRRLPDGVSTELLLPLSGKHAKQTTNKASPHGRHWIRSALATCRGLAAGELALGQQSSEAALEGTRGPGR